MKAAVVFVFLGLLPLSAMAEDVAPHIFTDLNGNGVSDLEENMSPGVNPSVEGIDQQELPPTPPEDPPTQ